MFRLAKVCSSSGFRFIELLILTSTFNIFIRSPNHSLILKYKIFQHTNLGIWMVLVSQVTQFIRSQTEKFLYRTQQNSTSVYNHNMSAQSNSMQFHRPTSELWRKQKRLEEGVEVASAPLVFDSAEIDVLSWWWRLDLLPFRKSSSAGDGRKAFLVLLKKISEHCKGSLFLYFIPVGYSVPFTRRDFSE